MLTTYHRSLAGVAMAAAVLLLTNSVPPSPTSRTGSASSGSMVDSAEVSASPDRSVGHPDIARRGRSEITSRVHALSRPRAQAERIRGTAPDLRRKRDPKPLQDPDTLLVTFPATVGSQERRTAAKDAGGRIVRSVYGSDVEVFAVAATEKTKVSERLRDDDRVLSVEPNLVRHAADTPNDPRFTFQANVLNSRLAAAWDLTHGSTTADIAIIDTGVDLDHPDLAPRIGSGRDFVNGDTSAQDDQGHGTNVAGIAAADSDNGIGIAGAAWDARIMPVKVLDSTGSGDDATIASGIRWATDNGAEIINLSLGAPGSSSTLSNAVAYAVANNVVVVAASGNEGSDVPSYPAAYSDVVAVGATDLYGDAAGFSNRGPWVDVVAQGHDVLTTALAPGSTDAYGGGAGTSFSAPLAAGVAALVRARFPALTSRQVHDRLRATAIDRGPAGIDDQYGWGLLDAYAAVGGRKAASPPASNRDAYESDDTADDARPIGSGTTGTISPEGDEDWFYVDTTQSGQIVVTVTPPAADDGNGALTFNPAIEAWSGTFEETPQGEVDQAPPGQPEAFYFSAATPGRYRFRVRNAASSRSTGPASRPDAYSVTSAFVPTAYTESPDERLWVRDLSPASFATGVPATVKPTVTFVRDVTEASAETSAKLLDVTTDTYVSIAQDYNVSTRILTLTPASNLIAAHSYLLSVAGAVDQTGSFTRVQDRVFTTRFTVAARARVTGLEADFNNDGFEDVVFAAPGEDHGSIADGGVVHVLYGASNGAQAGGSQMWSQDSAGIAGAVERGDRFGEAVATGDLNNDGYDDLVVGVPYEDLGSKTDAGLINVILGSSSGLRATGNSYWSQDSSGVPGGAESKDRFGGALAIGTFDGSSGADVAIGSPGESVGSAASAGSVHVLRGSSSGLTATGAVQWTQNSSGIEFFAETGDLFGAALAAGDLEGDGNDDLVIGAPFDDVSGTDEGSVTLVRGTISGPKPASVFPNFSSETERSGDRFGASVAIADVGGYSAVDRYADLVIGVPGRDTSALNNVGVVQLGYSDHSGPYLWSTEIDQSTSPAAAQEGGAWFGWSVAGYDDADGGAVAVGIPFADRGPGPLSDPGAVLVASTTSSVLADGFYGLGPAKLIDQETPGFAGASEAGDHFGASVSLTDSDKDGQPDLLIGVPAEGLGTVSGAGAGYVDRDVMTGSPVPSLFTQNTGGIASSAETGDRFGAVVS